MGPLLIASWWMQVYGPIESLMSSQRGMLQVCTVGMVLALFVIWWRK